jgi:hypothetical protein
MVCDRAVRVSLLRNRQPVEEVETTHASARWCRHHRRSHFSDPIGKEEHFPMPPPDFGALRAVK